ncbi:amidase [Roseovarius sp.]|uniref:amidase n=1 Tax=Roseovarius sp. TaxID=1486281 RepID=UPI003D0AEDB3
MDDYRAHDMTSLAGLVTRGEATPDDLLDTALARMQAVNPALNAVVHDYSDTARRMIADGLPKGPLTGVPFLLKDMGAESTRHPASLGSRLLANTSYRMNSTIYDRLEASGLVTFGRTAAPEGGVGAATEAAIYGGPTRNPWDIDRTPGGSSGGSGAAVAAGIVPAIEGFLTRSVRDTALLLDIVCGPDLGAPYVAPPMPCTCMESLDRPNGPLRIALCDTTLTGEAIHPECQAAVQDAAALLQELGHHVTQARPAADTTGMMHAWTKIVACGTASWVRAALAKQGRELRQGDIEGVARGAVAYAETISGADYLDAVETVHAYGRRMAAFFQDYDILLTPTLAEPPAAIGRFAHDTEDYVAYRVGEGGIFAYSPYTAAFNATGQPAVSLPLCRGADGLPIGIHLAARFGADTALMSLCADLERARPWFDQIPALPGIDT